MIFAYMPDLLHIFIVFIYNINMISKTFAKLLLSSFLLLTILSTTSAAAELHFVPNSSENDIELDLMIDKAEKVAGMKLVLGL